MNLRTCVDPSGKFIYGIHKPCFRVDNLRVNDCIKPIGWSADGEPIENSDNFPPADVEELSADTVYEIPNPFPFKGVTYIVQRWAKEKAKDPQSISLPAPPRVSFAKSIEKWKGRQKRTADWLKSALQNVDEPIRLAIAGTSTDPKDLIVLAQISCDLVYDSSGKRPLGLRYQPDNSGQSKPVVRDHLLYETVCNNPALPDEYKKVMVLRPGVQGRSEIVGEWVSENVRSHIYEYLRRNSYIPGGHYAANMADDAIRYRIIDLTLEDMFGLRHLYYQRTYIRMAEELQIGVSDRRRIIPADELETLRKKIFKKMKSADVRQKLKYNRTLWGWNFGFDYAPSKYRLHASHQQVHQQYALIPKKAFIDDPGKVDGHLAGDFAAYACGDLIAGFIDQYFRQTGKDFFDAYIEAIKTNARMDGKKKESSLIVFSDPRVMLFVPKAQTSQWELQLMTIKPVGNILEADTKTRRSIDQAMLMAVRTLGQMGAKMITAIEYSKAFDSNQSGQRLLYAFLPRLPESPGAFSEAQLRWINGHYPEDFSAACRYRLKQPER